MTLELYLQLTVNWKLRWNPFSCQNDQTKKKKRGQWFEKKNPGIEMISLTQTNMTTAKPRELKQAVKVVILKADRISLHMN